MNSPPVRTGTTFKMVAAHQATHLHQEDIQLNLVQGKPPLNKDRCVLEATPI